MANAGLLTDRGIWRDAYRELMRPRNVAVALVSMILFTVALGIIGPLGTSTLAPLPRFAYWQLCAATTYPVCFALVAVALYLTRHRSLIEIVLAVATAVLIEGVLCTAVMIAADTPVSPRAHAPPEADESAACVPDRDDRGRGVYLLCPLRRLPADQPRPCGTGHGRRRRQAPHRRFRRLAVAACRQHGRRRGSGACGAHKAAVAGSGTVHCLAGAVPRSPVPRGEP